VIVFTDRQRAVLAEHGIAVSDRDVPADHICPWEVAA
jgi:hypothetical protein